jgi:transposase
LDCTIVNFDEATFRLVPFNRKIWAKKGSRPVGKFWWSNKKANIFGALIDGKEFYYEWYDRLNAHYFIEFMTRFVKTLDKNKKYVFVFDNAPAHRAKMSKEYLKTIPNVFIEFLPPYSPQLNCIESCFKIIRHDVTNSNFYDCIEKLKKGVDLFLDGHFFMFIPSNYLSR